MMLPWWFAIVQNGFLRGNCKNSIAKHWAVKWGRRTEASLAEKGNATHVEHVWEHVWNAFHQTRVDNSSMWLLRLALAFGAMRPLRSSVATGNWEGDVTLPLAIAFGWLSIADKSGSRFLDDLELLSFCQTAMLCSMAHPLRTMPNVTTMLVLIAGVEGNWSIV